MLQWHLVGLDLNVIFTVATVTGSGLPSESKGREYKKGPSEHRALPSELSASVDYQKIKRN